MENKAILPIASPISSAEEAGHFPQVVDPTVSRAKFDREVNAFRSNEDDQRKRGILLLRAEFPRVQLAFAAPQVFPTPIVFGANLDFTNYDLAPPSVVLTNPFTQIPYRMKEMLTQFPRLLQPNPPAFQLLLQAYGPDDIPFLCIPGIREYHEHAAHTGDSWFLHRQQGEGTLHFIVEQLYTYGIMPLAGYNIAFQLNGFSFGKIPQ